MLPNFLVIGAMKAGTTSLYEYLRGHPQVFMPEKKELDFFVRELNLRRGQPWYEGQFIGAGEEIAVGEASTSYTKYPHHQGVPSRIVKLIPEVRLIYVIRHPIERMRSQYLHELLLGEERLPMEKALLRRPRYRDFSSYAMQIAQYLEHFASQRLLVVRAEELRSDRRAVMGRVGEFLGLDPNGRWLALEREFHRTEEKRVPRSVARRVVRSSFYKKLSPFVPSAAKRFGRRFMEQSVDPKRGRMTDDLRERLEDMVRDDVRALRVYLGDGFDGWGIA